MNAALVVIRKGKPSQAAPLVEGSNLVGRDDSCRLRIPAAAVSRRHCEFLVAEAGVQVRDLGSSNGTYVNGKRLEDDSLTAIEPGDLVVVGETPFFLQIDGAPDAPSATVKSRSGAKQQAAPDAPTQASEPPSGDEELKSVLDDLDFDPNEDSSVVDFDFDLDDDEGPKL